jgi:hypothetical protein
VCLCAVLVAVDDNLHLLLHVCVGSGKARRAPTTMFSRAWLRRKTSRKVSGSPPGSRNHISFMRAASSASGEEAAPPPRLPPSTCQNRLSAMLSWCIQTAMLRLVYLRRLPTSDGCQSQTAMLRLISDSCQSDNTMHPSRIFAGDERNMLHAVHPTHAHDAHVD